MWRFKYGGGRANKRDTPMKPALTRRDKQHSRLLPDKHYEAFPEEPEVEEMDVKPTNQVWTQTSMKPVHCKSVLSLSSSAFTENPRDKTVSPAMPANKKSGHQVSSGHPAIQLTPDPEAFKAGEMPVKEEQNLAVTPESIMTSSMESDTTFSSDEDEDDCYSSTSTTSSSLPSPEIFREENYVKMFTFPIEEDLLDLHLHIKNSTLLDVSLNESIGKYHPPNLSTIIDASTILAENKPELSNHRVIEVEPKTHREPFQSEKASKRKTPPKPTITRPILCKKVRFKSPVIAESFETKTIPAIKLTTYNESEPVHWSSPAEQIKHDADTSRADEISSKDDTLHLTLKRPAKEQAKFFDFGSDGDRDEFFRRERQRFARLRSFSLFPLTAAKRIEPAVP